MEALTVDGTALGNGRPEDIPVDKNVIPLSASSVFIHFGKTGSGKY